MTTTVTPSRDTLLAQFHRANGLAHAARGHGAAEHVISAYTEEADDLFIAYTCAPRD